MPSIAKRTRRNVGEIRNELDRKQLPTESKRKSILLVPYDSLDKIDQLHYRAYIKNIITLKSLKTNTNENNYRR